jgi:hypothetical protein
VNATELATVVEGWATLAGLIVVITGATFAGVQLRRDSGSRRLQSLLSLYEVIWPTKMLRAARIVRSLQDDFEFDQLEPAQKDAVMQVTASLERLGHLLRAGLVQEREIFDFTPLGRMPVFFWEKLKHFIRTGTPVYGGEGDGLHVDVDFEYSCRGHRSTLPIAA